MAFPERLDAVVVGAGPNGLAAGITLAGAGCSVLLREGAATVGGAVRSAALTLPGFVHDLGSAIHPLGLGSPFFRTLPLERHGLRWVHPPLAAAHPFDDGTAAVLHPSLEATAAGLGPDEGAWHRLLEPIVSAWEMLADDLLAPPRLPRHPILFARFGQLAFRAARPLAERRFRGEKARALFAGLAAHGSLPLEAPLTASFGLVLAALGHRVGWPMPLGGAQALAAALAAHFESLGGTIETGVPVTSLDELPPARVVLCDVTPRQFLSLAGPRLSTASRAHFAAHRYGPGVFKLDWALRGPIPWRAAECAGAGTVHLGGSLSEIAASEASVWSGTVPERPYVIVAQQSLFDATRAPPGCHTAWAYCHVPNGSTVDAAERIEAQIERFAPGFRDLVLARSVITPARLEELDPNCVGGDIGGGVLSAGRLLAAALPPGPYRTPVPGVYLCSASTPPGGGVHGLCGHHAARAALRELRC